MKEEVNGYLKKHNKETVPPVLRTRHYLLIDTINHLGKTKSFKSPQKLIKDLSSEAVRPVSETDKFEPLRNLTIERKQNNRIVKQKRGISVSNNFYNGEEAEVSCVLPNICNIKLSFDSNFIDNYQTKKQSAEEKRRN